MHEKKGTWKDTLQLSHEKTKLIEQLKTENLKQRQTISRQGEDIAELRKVIGRRNTTIKRKEKRITSLEDSNRDLRRNR